MNDLISRLSELRCQYNCFDENERDAYHTLSEAIKALSDVPGTNVGDMISRQAAINGLQAEIDNPMQNPLIRCGIRLARNYINDLPSAQPEIVRCKDCRYWDKTKYSDYATMGECTIWHTARNRKEYCSEGRVKDGKDNG